MTSRCLFFLAGIFFSAPSLSWDDDAPRLRMDPFARPDLAVKPSTGKAKLDGAAVSKWNPVLLSTLRADESSMVNVAGRILMLGEEIDGYELIEVKERSAVFEKAGKRYILEMDARANDDANS